MGYTRFDFYLPVCLCTAARTPAVLLPPQHTAADGSFLHLYHMVRDGRNNACFLYRTIPLPRLRCLLPTRCLRDVVTYAHTLPPHATHTFTLCGQRRDIYSLLPATVLLQMPATGYLPPPLPATLLPFKRYLLYTTLSPALRLVSHHHTRRIPTPFPLLPALTCHHRAAPPMAITLRATLSCWLVCLRFCRLCHAFARCDRILFFYHRTHTPTRFSALYHFLWHFVILWRRWFRFVGLPRFILPPHSTSPPPLPYLPLPLPFYLL